MSHIQPGIHMLHCHRSGTGEGIHAHVYWKFHSSISRNISCVRWINETSSICENISLYTVVWMFYDVYWLELKETVKVHNQVGTKHGRVKKDAYTSVRKCTRAVQCCFSKDFSLVAVSFSEPKNYIVLSIQFQFPVVLCNILFGYSQLQGDKCTKAAIL